MKGRFAFIFVILLFFSLILRANKPVFTDHYQSIYKFSFVQSATSNERRTNYVLQQIAFDNSISFPDINLQLSYTLNVTIQQLSDQKSVLNLELKIDEITGDICIRKMDVSGFLLPGICTFEYRLFNKKTGEVYEQVLVNNRLNDEVLIVNRSIAARLERNEVGLEFYGLAFYYSEQDVMRFKSYVSVIEDYYASACLADSLLAKAATWRPDDGRNLVWNYFKISEFERIYSTIQNKNFNESLNLSDNDPAVLLKKLDDLSGQSRRLRTLLKEGAKGSKLYFPNEVLLAQQIVDCQRQYDNFLKGSDFNNSRFLEELSNVNYSNAWFLKMYSFFVKGLNKRQQASVNNYFERFVRALQNTHLSVAEQLFQTKNFMKAAIQVENAKRLNTRLNKTNEDELKKLQHSIVYGLYHSYLSVAHRALSVPNIALARHYLDKALAYQKRNVEFIPRNDAIRKAYRKLINELIKKAAILKANKHFPEASTILIEAITMSSDIGAYDLERKIKVELLDIYKLESYRITKLNDSRILDTETKRDQKLKNELVRLKGSQQNILNQLQQLKRE